MYSLQNDAKRERAQLKARLEIEARERLEADIARLTAELVKQKAEKTAIEEELGRLRRYAQYLEAVVAAANTGSAGVGVSERFDEVKDVLSRYEVLSRTNRDLHEQVSISESLGRGCWPVHFY